MTWTTTGDPDAFLDAAGAFLRAAPATNSVTLTTVEALRARGPDARGGERPPLLAWWQAPGEAASGTAMHTPPYPLHVGAMSPAAATALADLLAARGHALPGVNGEAAATGAFAAAWSARTGASARVFRRMRLHRLDTLVPPDPLPPGTAVVAGPQHRDLLVAWHDAFAAEIEAAAARPRPAGRTTASRMPAWRCGWSTARPSRSPARPARSPARRAWRRSTRRPSTAAAATPPG